jgi:hypothetical protein
MKGHDPSQNKQQEAVLHAKKLSILFCCRFGTGFGSILQKDHPDGSDAI